MRPPSSRYSKKPTHNSGANSIVSSLFGSIDNVAGDIGKTITDNNPINQVANVITKGERTFGFVLLGVVGAIAYIWVGNPTAVSSVANRGFDSFDRVIDRL